MKDSPIWIKAATGVLDIVECFFDNVYSNSLICVYGPTGSGKTALLQRIEKTFGGEKVLRVGVESLTQDLVSALESGNKTKFLHKYLDKSCLLIDNLWLLKNRKSTATEIISMLAKRIRGGGLTILTSDIPQQEWNEKNIMIADLLASAQSITLNPDV